MSTDKGLCQRIHQETNMQSERYLTSLIVLMAGLMISAADAWAKESKPNVIVILADDKAAHERQTARFDRESVCFYRDSTQFEIAGDHGQFRAIRWN
ncbi:MAG TPA: hypothetical protein VHV77_02990 [Pirellulales bacterium]|jgi:hypothetical protein|nr:hypothetical protein [Pirellulales bacterium]